jgi:hypothetical protein
VPREGSPRWPLRTHSGTRIAQDATSWDFIASSCVGSVGANSAAVRLDVAQWTSRWRRSIVARRASMFRRERSR